MCEYVHERSEYMDQGEEEEGECWLWGNGGPKEGPWLFFLVK